MIGKIQSCAVIGHGSWATALVSILAGNGIDVRWSVRNPEVIDGVRQTGRNPRYLPSLRLPMDRISVYDNPDDAISDAPMVLVSVPSAFLKLYMENVQSCLCDRFVVSAIKGIVPGDYKTAIEWLHDTYSLSYSKMGMISGPSHAEEIAQEKLTCLTIVCPDKGDAQAIGSCLANGFVHVGYSSDLYGIEYAVVLKNIFAIAAGIASGLGYGDNFKAVLVSAAADEMERFIDIGYPYERDICTPAYLGDLLVTCYSTFSRNRRLGQLIGQGLTVKSALNEMTMVAEGYYAADCIRHMNLRYKADMPIADMVYDVLYRSVPARVAMAALIERI